MHRKALVSGASGFIGQVLCDQLKAGGWLVRALMRRAEDGPWDETFVCDLARDGLAAEAFADIDAIFHLAGMAHAGGAVDSQYRRVNVEGTRRILEAAVAAGIPRFVYFSSVKAVADPPEGDCIDDTWDAWPETAYGRSKREAEEVLSSVATRSGMHAVILRPTLVYGPNVKGNLRKIIQLVASGLCPPLPDTSNLRSMVHVDDLCELAIKAVHQPSAAGRRYIVADARPYSTYELYQGILSAMGKSVPSWSLPAGLFRAAGRLGDLGELLIRHRLPVNSGMVSRLLDSSCYRSARCQEELDWQPRHELPAAIPAMVAAWRKEHAEHGERQVTAKH